MHIHCLRFFIYLSKSLELKLWIFYHYSKGVLKMRQNWYFGASGPLATLRENFCERDLQLKTSCVLCTAPHLKLYTRLIFLSPSFQGKTLIKEFEWFKSKTRLRGMKIGKFWIAQRTLNLKCRHFKNPADSLFAHKSCIKCNLRIIQSMLKCKDESGLHRVLLW